MSVVKYRPAIDGLRAVAVIAVLLFHLDKYLLPGGFVGVDIFFVISGYLITSIIIADCEKGEFSFAKFYQRRISRIYPVFFLVSIAILITAFLLYLPQDFASAGATVIAAAFSITNLKLILQGNYFQVSSDAQPFLHFWSLAVEEQFYIIFPLIVYLSFRFKISRNILSKVLILIAVISLIAYIVLTSTNPTWAFYLLPTRAWELLAGCILATYPVRNSILNYEKLDIFLSNLGLLTVVISVFIIHEKMPFLGFFATIPIIGSVLVIGRKSHPKGIAERILSYPFIVFIGKISYSLYLWHWAIYSFVDYSLYQYSPLLRGSLKIIFTAVFSITSYYYFEKPIRSYLNHPKNQTFSFTAFGIGVLVLFTIGYFIRTENYREPLKSVFS